MVPEVDEVSSGEVVDSAPYSSASSCVWGPGSVDAA